MAWIFLAESEDSPRPSKATCGPVAYCENDRYATGVLLSRMATGEIPTAPIWDDVATLDGDTLPTHPEIIYGGFPCQDISVAGRGGGLDAERSGLFFEIARLVSEIRPQFVFLENVAAITVRGAERVVGEFCKLGYDARWGILSAADVGANHRRERWWLLAKSNSKGQPSIKVRSEQGRLPSSAGASSYVAHTIPTEQWRDEREGEVKGDALADAKGSGRGQGHPNAGGMRTGALATQERTGSANDGWWKVEPGICGMADGLPEELDGFGIMGRYVEEKISASHRMGSKGSTESGFEGVLRGLFDEIVSRFAPHGWQSEEQFIKEFALALRQLPHPLTLDQRKASVATTQALLFGLRQALKALGTLRNPSHTCYAAWESLPEAEKDWAFMAARFGVFHEEWPGVPRVASGVKFRVGRLRGLGNAVVPAQAREAFERLIGLK